VYLKKSLISQKSNNKINKAVTNVVVVAKDIVEIKVVEEIEDVVKAEDDLVVEEGDNEPAFVHTARLQQLLFISTLQPSRHRYAIPERYPRNTTSPTRKLRCDTFKHLLLLA